MPNDPTTIHWMKVAWHLLALAEGCPRHAAYRGKTVVVNNCQLCMTVRYSWLALYGGESCEKEIPHEQIALL